MAQCPGCHKIDTSHGYLRSHLQQSVCITLLNYGGTNVRTNTGRVPSPTLPDRQENEDIVHAPLPSAMQIRMQANVVLLGELNQDIFSATFSRMPLPAALGGQR